MEKKIIEIKSEKEIFVADDGTEFATERECEDYERAVRWVNILKLPTRIPELNDVCPLNYEENSESSNFVWFKLVSQEDVETLNKLLPETVDGFVQTGLVCVENRFDDYYTFYFEDSYEYVLKFFAHFDIAVEFSPSEKPVAKSKSCDICKECLCSSCVENQSLTVVGRCDGCKRCGEEDVSCLIAETISPV